MFVVIPLLVVAGWAALIIWSLAIRRRKTVEWNGHRVFSGIPVLAATDTFHEVLEVGVEYVANYVVDIRRNCPDQWRDFADPDRFGEIPLDGIEGGKDFRAFGTAPEIARMLVADPFVRAEMQKQFRDRHDSLFIDSEGVRVRRLFGAPIYPMSPAFRLPLFIDTSALVTEARPLAVAAYERLRSAATQHLPL
jgi:hypothetical protein